MDKKTTSWDFPAGPVVKNLPCNSGDMGSIPGPESNILLAVGQLSLWVLEPVSHNERSCMLQLIPQGKQK